MTEYNTSIHVVEFLITFEFSKRFPVTLSWNANVRCSEICGRRMAYRYGNAYHELPSCPVVVVSSLIKVANLCKELKPLFCNKGPRSRGRIFSKLIHARKESEEDDSSQAFRILIKLVLAPYRAPQRGRHSACSYLREASPLLPHSNLEPCRMLYSSSIIITRLPYNGRSHSSTPAIHHKS